MPRIWLGLALGPEECIITTAVDTHHFESIVGLSAVGLNLPDMPIFVATGVAKLFNKLNVSVCGRGKRCELGPQSLRERLGRIWKPGKGLHRVVEHFRIIPVRGVFLNKKDLGRVEASKTTLCQGGESC